MTHFPDDYSALYAVNALVPGLPFSADEKITIAHTMNHHPDVDPAAILRALRVRALDNTAPPFDAYRCTHHACATYMAIKAAQK